MFSGSSLARVDEKGRLKVPADFMRVVREKYDREFFITSKDGERAEIYPMKEWEIFENKIATIPYSPAKRKLEDILSYYGSVVEMDAQGRLLLPQQLRNKMGSVDDVTVLGKITYLESINADIFQHRLSALDPTADFNEEFLSYQGLYDLSERGPLKEGALISAAEPLIVSVNERIVQLLKKDPKEVYKLTPRQFEEVIAELLDDMGCDVTLTKATRDGGKDILASHETPAGRMLFLVETKLYRPTNKVGVSLVRSLYGTLCDYQANSAMLVTTSSFSRDAYALQQKHQYQLSLKNYTDVVDWIEKYGLTRGSHRRFE